LQRQAQERILQDDHTIVFSESSAELLLRVATQIAALDAMHHQLAGIQSPADPNQDWRVSTGSEDIFLIPRRTLYRTSSRSRGFRDLSRRRDLMPYHRILSTKLEGFHVRLTWRDLAGGWPPKLKLGGVLFPGLEFTIAKTAKSFLITGVVCAGQDS